MAITIGDCVLVAVERTVPVYLRNKIGTVRCIKGDCVGIEFPFKVVDGVDLEGCCLRPYGFWISIFLLTKLTEVKQLFQSGKFPSGKCKNEIIEL